MTPENKLSERGFALPVPPAAAANYLPVARTGNLLFVSGQISTDDTGIIKGTLGQNMDVAAGQKAAERCALNILAQIVHGAKVEMSAIKRIVKLTVLVASTPDFFDQHLVANGASDLFADLLGDKGQHARAAFGVAALPLGAAVEIDAVIEV